MPGKRNSTAITTTKGPRQDIFAIHDNAPMLEPTQFGIGGTPNYYHGDEPSPYMLAKMARFTPIGFRLTHGYAADLCNNQFGLAWPHEPIASEDKVSRNTKFRQHMKAIKGFIEWQKGIGFDREQGENLFIIYREGDGVANPNEMPKNIKMLAENNQRQTPVMNASPVSITQTPQLANPTPPNVRLTSNDPYGNAVQYYNFAEPADLTRRVIRIEAYNKLNYSIPFINSFGLPEYYLINFYTRGNVLVQYYVHPSRVIRMKLYNITYEQWSGHGALKCCYPQLVILSNIDRMAGVAATRWAYQVPVFMTRNLRTQQDQQTFATKLGNPSAATWLVLPSESITDVKMIGPQSGIMRLDDFAQMMINEISAGTGFPATILMNQKVGVLGSGEVNLKEYFAKLDADHSLINPFIEQFIAIDPELREIAGEDFEIDWGIRHVMTEEDRVELDVKKLANCNAMMGFSTLNEVRAYWGAEPWEIHLKRLKLGEWAKTIYNDLPPEVLANVMIPNLGEWKQAFLQATINPDQGGNQSGFGNPEAKKTSEELGKNETGAHAAELAAKGQQDPVQREQNRRQVMYQKQGARRAGYDLDIDKLSWDLAEFLTEHRTISGSWYAMMAEAGVTSHQSADKVREWVYKNLREKAKAEKEQK